MASQMSSQFRQVSGRGNELWPEPVACKYFFFRAGRSTGSPSTDPIRSAIGVKEAARRRLPGACSSRSRTTSDFEIFRPRDSASMSATNASGNHTVRLFMK